MESSLPLISFFIVKFVESRNDVELGEELGIGQMIEGLLQLGNRVSVLDGDVVKFLVIHTYLNVGGGFSLKQRLPCQGNITAVVFPKWLKLSVINRAHSALTSFGMGLTYGSSLKSQKPCQGFIEILLRFWYLFRLPFWASSEATSVILTELLCFSLLSFCVHIFILKFFVAARL